MPAMCQDDASAKAALDGPVALTVVIPAYNEERRIGASLERMVDYLARGPASCELIVVDDGSADGTAQVVTAAAQDNPCIRLVRNERNRGKGRAVARGMLEARGEALVFSDADLSTPIEELDRMLPLLEDHDVVFASRRLAESSIEVRQSRLREFAGRVFHLLVRLIALPGVRDSQCGFKLFRAEAARFLFSRLTVDGWAFDVEILGLAQKSGMRIIETPVTWRNSADSKVRSLDPLHMFVDLFRIRLRLMRFDERFAG